MTSFPSGDPFGPQLAAPTADTGRTFCRDDEVLDGRLYARGAQNSPNGRRSKCGCLTCRVTTRLFGSSRRRPRGRRRIRDGLLRKRRPSTPRFARGEVDFRSPSFSKTAPNRSGHPSTESSFRQHLLERRASDGLRVSKTSRDVAFSREGRTRPNDPTESFGLLGRLWP